MGVPGERAPAQRVGAPEWRARSQALTGRARALAERGAGAVQALWQPVPGSEPAPPEGAPCRAELLRPWRFRAETQLGGGAVEKPPPGEGATLWRSRLKPPAWRARLPPPQLRDALALRADARVHAHARGVRLVAARLGRALQQLDRQLGLLLRARADTERRLSRVRAGLALNRDGVRLRGLRPPSEQIPDKADSTLTWERDELRHMKRKMEVDMEKSELLLKALASCRDSLDLCYKERLQAADLMNQPMDKVLEQAGRHSWVSLSRIPTPRTQGQKTPPVDPAGIYTPDCARSLHDARQLVLESQDVLLEMHKNQDHVGKQQRQVGERVCATLAQKMHESEELKEKMILALGQLRGTMVRCSKFKEEMLNSKDFLRGPVSTQYLQTREKLDRPLVRMLQRHLGTQLPEAAFLIQGSEKLQRQVSQLEKTLQQLQLRRQALVEDVRCKQLGQEVDHSVIRQRLRLNSFHARHERQAQGPTGGDWGASSPPPAATQ